MRKFYYILIGLLCVFLLFGCGSKKELKSLQIVGTNNLLVGEQAKLDILVSPISEENKKVKWETYDESIISIDDNGVIVGLKEGKAVVVATSLVDEKYESIFVIDVIEYKYANDPDEIKLTSEFQKKLDNLFDLFDGKYLYYGITNDVHLFSIKSYNQVISRKFKIANYEFVYKNANEVIYCLKNDKCYELIDAFEVGWFNDADLAYIWHNYILFEKNYTELTNAFLSKHKLSFENNSEQIQITTYIENTNITINNEERNCYIMAVSHSQVINVMSPLIEEIEDIEFNYYDGNRLYIFLNNEKKYEQGLLKTKYTLCTLTEAYEFGFITKDQLLDINNKYNTKVDLRIRYNKLQGN